jgi:hypothetical protein
MHAAPVVDVTSSGAAAALLLLLFRLRCRVVVAVVAVVLVEDEDDDDEDDEDLDKTPRQLLDRVDVDEQPPRLASMFVAYMIDESINCKYDVDVFAMYQLRDVEVRLDLLDYCKCRNEWQKKRLDWRQQRNQHNSSTSPTPKPEPRLPALEKLLNRMTGSNDHWER